MINPKGNRNPTVPSFLFSFLDIKSIYKYILLQDFSLWCPLQKDTLKPPPKLPTAFFGACFSVLSLAKDRNIPRVVEGVRVRAEDLFFGCSEYILMRGWGSKRTAELCTLEVSTSAQCWIKLNRSHKGGVCQVAFKESVLKRDHCASSHTTSWILGYCHYN